MDYENNNEKQNLDYDKLNNNRVIVSGEIISEPVFSHENNGEGFYEFKLSVDRLSQIKDELPVTISERLIDGNVKTGNKITIKGQFRSFNKPKDENKSTLMLTVFTREVCEFNDEINPNIIEIEGYLCKAPIYRTTPFKKEICDILLAVNRPYNKSDYIPCIAWGRNARFIRDGEVGSRIFISGRIQSRDYQKKHPDGSVENKRAYEVSISKISGENLFNDINFDMLSADDSYYGEAKVAGK